MASEDLSFDIQFLENILKHSPDSIEAMEILSNLYTEAGLIQDGLRLDKKIVKLQPNNPIGFYNLACSLALSAQKIASINALEKAIHLGYRDIDWMLEDPHLASLQNNHRFLELINKLEQLIELT